MNNNHNLSIDAKWRLSDAALNKPALQELFVFTQLQLYWPKEFIIYHCYCIVGLFYIMISEAT